MEHLQGSLKLTLGGQSRQLFFDHYFLSLLNEFLPAGEFEDFAAKNPFRLIPVITLYALKAGDDVNDLPANLSERIVSRWLMELSPEANAQILELYKHSMGFMSALFNAVGKASENGKAQSHN